jgi:hypothetical protein
MAERTPILTDVAQVADESGNEGVSGSVGLNAHCRSLEDPAASGSGPAGSTAAR